jgi:ABC-2 type transport system permease protein
MMFATAKRVMQQLLHDRRTLALLFIAPCVLLGLLAWMYHDIPHMFDKVGPPLLGIFPFVIMFLTTSVTTLRERSSGTLERLLVLPIGKLDIILGYALAFGTVGLLQAFIASMLAVHGYGLHVAGPEWFLISVALADALLGMALGLLVSAFARTEFQAVQFLPAFILPQFLLCGLLVPVDRLPHVLEVLARCLPLTYAVEAMKQVASTTNVSGGMYRNVLVVLSFVVVALVLGALTLRRQTK